MNKPAEVAVTKADREAYLSLNTLPKKYRDAVMAGVWDQTTGVQAFARHRTTNHQALVDALEKIAARKWDSMTQGCDAAAEAKSIARQALSTLSEAKQ